ncbi:hypothetical protein WR25_27104 [Diploscapter pachys]|uniref:Uncharacterized protein n=1 Tax=Diploscapter pachys TaxID=2018661 RepID=A0A2A2M3I9_9BILA|nr:hypothetical protein WR25_27104 [Diploscapter pachys]
MPSRMRRDVEARRVETRAQWQRGDQRVVAPLARAGADAALGDADRTDRFACHQRTDRPQHRDIDDADHRIDLATRLEQLEDPRARPAAEDTAGHQDAAHLHVDAAAVEMREHARHARARHLAGRGGGGDGGRNAVDDEQWRRQKAAADPEHARQQPDAAAQQDDDQRVDRQVGDGEVEVHERLYTRLAPRD